MENDLDEKLHDLLYDEASSYYFEGSSPEWFEKECPELIEKFKQAFKDSGYSKPPLAGIKAQMEIGGMMTGQEWYNRFKTEFEKDGSVSYNGDMLAFARRIAGIE